MRDQQNNHKTINLPQGSILKWRFRSSSRHCFLNSLVFSFATHNTKHCEFLTRFIALFHSLTTQKSSRQNEDIFEKDYLKGKTLKP